MSQIRMALITTTLCLDIFLISAALWSARTFSTLVDQAQLSHEISRSAEVVKMTLVDAETGTRGFIITGDEAFLQPYNNSTWHIDSDVNALSIYVSRQPTERAMVAKIADLSHKKMDILANSITSRKDIGFRAARETVVIAGSSASAQPGGGKYVMDEVRTMVEQIQSNENIRSNKLIEESKFYALISTFGAIGFAISAVFSVLLLQIIVKRPDLLP
jgi:CHASE3 domain sensor protein